jgi:voltage-gated potassium channel Kch
MTRSQRGWLRSLKLEDWVILVPALSAIVLGTIGFIGSAKNHVPDDPFFRALALLTGSGVEATENPWLRVARWFGVIFVFAAAMRFLARNLGATLTAFRTKRTHDHEVVIGLGTKGRTLLTLPSQHYINPTRLWDYLWPAHRVGLDRDVASAEGVSFGTRSLIVAGDATTDKSLEMVSVAEADRVIIATKEDALNIAIAERVRRLIPAARKDNPLRITVHVADPVLRNEAFSGTAEDTPVIVSPFALPETAARTLLRRFPVATRAREYGGSGVNLVFIGFDDYAEALLVQVLRLGRLTKQAHPLLTVFAAEDAGVEDRLRRRYAAAFEDKTFGLQNSIRVVPFDLARELRVSDVLPTEPDGQPVTAVFVQAETDAKAYTLALRTRRTARAHGAWKVPFFVRLDDPAVLAGVLTYLPGQSGPDQTSVSPVLEDVLEPYGALAPTLVASVYEGKRMEQLARALHERYLENHYGDARPVAKDEWSRLPEEAREANRRAIDHFGLKLASAGFVVRGDALHATGPLGLGAGDIGAELAGLEHESWSREKLLAGWRFGTPRNNARRRHDCLVSFDRLSPRLQSRDLEQIRAVEKLLLTSSTKPDAPTIFRERVIAVASDSLAARAGDPGRLREEVRLALESLGVQGKLGPQGDEFWTFLTPLAPGSDCLIARAIAAQLQPRFRGRFRLRVVQPLPLPLMVAAWRDRGGFALGAPDGFSPLEAAAQEGKPGVFSKDAKGAPIPDLRKVEELLRKLVKEPDIEVEACVDLSPASLSVSDWSGEAFSLSDAFVATMEAAAKRFETYVLSLADELIAACSISPTPVEPTSAAEALVRAWTSAGRKVPHVIRFDDEAVCPQESS